MKPDAGVVTTEPFGGPESVRRLRDRLRTAAFIILTAGIAGAGLLYWLEMRFAGPTMDELMPGYARMDARQMGILFGSTGVFLSEGLENLKRPDVQAIILVVVSVLVAWGCLHIARLLSEDEPADDRPPGHGR